MEHLSLSLCDCSQRCLYLVKQLFSATSNIINGACTSNSYHNIMIHNYRHREKEKEGGREVQRDITAVHLSELHLHLSTRPGSIHLGVI